MHKPSAQGNFCDEYRKAQKPVITENYSHHMAYANNGTELFNWQGNMGVNNVYFSFQT
jgi:hypothetical protein